MKGTRELFFTIDEVAEAMKVHKDTVVAWIEKGYIRVFKTERVIRIHAEDLADFVFSRSTQNKGD